MAGRARSDFGDVGVRTNLDGLLAALVGHVDGRRCAPPDVEATWPSVMVATLPLVMVVFGGPIGIVAFTHAPHAFRENVALGRMQQVVGALDRRAADELARAQVGHRALAAHHDVGLVRQGQLHIAAMLGMDHKGIAAGAGDRAAEADQAGKGIGGRGRGRAPAPAPTRYRRPAAARRPRSWILGTLTFSLRRRNAHRHWLVYICRPMRRGISLHPGSPIGRGQYPAGRGL